MNERIGRQGLGYNPSAKINYFCSSAVNSTHLQIHCISQQNFQFYSIFTPHISLPFFMSSFNFLLSYLLWAKLPHGQIVTQQKCLWQGYLLRKQQTQLGTNERDLDHIVCSKSGETICIHISFYSVNTMESLWPTVNLLLSVHLGEC